MKPTMELEISNRQEAVEVPEDGIRRIAACALEAEGRAAEISVAVVGDAAMRELNGRFTGRDTVTDVLAFPYEVDGEVICGEVIVNAELAAREAAGRGHSVQDELMLYVAHGMLHLVGYDDHSAEDTDLMRARERAVLEAAGFQAAF